jgi:sulfate adenylyltransferase
MYAKARRGEITGFTGIDDPYESPVDPEITLDTVGVSKEGNGQRIFDYLVNEGFVRTD